MNFCHFGNDNFSRFQRITSGWESWKIHRPKELPIRGMRSFLSSCYSFFCLAAPIPSSCFLFDCFFYIIDISFQHVHCNTPAVIQQPDWLTNKTPHFPTGSVPTTALLTSTHSQTHSASLSYLTRSRLYRFLWETRRTIKEISSFFHDQQTHKEFSRNPA